jgi:hypothetical protein
LIQVWMKYVENGGGESSVGCSLCGEDEYQNTSGDTG